MENKLINEIQQLKKEKNAIILAHYYVSDELQELADYVGDSFYLAKVAKGTDADVLVFCGVSFMGESAKMLNPEKTVLMPDATADCPMAHMAQVAKIKELREKCEDLAVVCYINSTAELKSYSDVCVTSSNAVKIVRNLPNRNIFFIPDGNLGRFVAEQVPEKNVILNDGYCPIHKDITAAGVQAQKDKYPNALVLVHPECEESVLALADYIGSTAEIISFAKESDCKEFIICTEEGVSYRLREDNPDKKFYFGRDYCCPDMKLNTLEKVLHVLKTGENAVELSEETCKRAVLPLDRMLELAK
ncbi:MAG: quinolinate synthase NadA [Lachnospiraceae bacterium]|nr:quinolinate synthase NadA [Lachnospiraceae bacterium]